jgi:hypothetical protein
MKGDTQTKATDFTIEKILEILQMSINGIMDQQNVVYL